MQFFVNQFSPAPPTPTPQLKSKFKSPKGRMLYNNTWSQDFSYCKHERSEPKDDDDVHRSFADLTDRKFWKIKNPLPPVSTSETSVADFELFNNHQPQKP